jgi:hypothetical protein
MPDCWTRQRSEERGSKISANPPRYENHAILLILPSEFQFYFSKKGGAHSGPGDGFGPQEAGDLRETGIISQAIL